jgi:heptosyltransferase-2
MTTPALRRLRERFPGARITLLTHEKLSELWLHHPSLNDVVTFAPGEIPWSVARRLRPEQFDTALIFPNSPRSALEVWLAGIPQRVGYARPWRTWFLTQNVPARPDRVAMRKRSRHEIIDLIDPEVVAPPSRRGLKEEDHALVAPESAGGGSRINPEGFRDTPHSKPHQIFEYLHLTAALGASSKPLATELGIRDDEVESVKRKWLAGGLKLTKNAISGKPPIWLGLNPGAAYGPAKRWPAENFAGVVQEVSREFADCVWIAFGEANDGKLCDEIAQRSGGNILNLAGRTTLRELMALLKLCRVLLTNDSGPMHIAAALGTPVVVPFGSTAAELTGPGLPGDPRHRLLNAGAPCSPCFRRTCPIDFRCMTGITIAHAVKAVLQAIST